ncbi:uncharacterized protein LOC125242304 [Leguminivora glycinivorella]|uniref:uncharacterized protein LOC125242304 n=1 Tax=Leguminivora glycinivorella TaxID=1035111 RepID=UPI00200D2E17|nr:uncharacterized protein LOC125242304 [Leguminivora glycinivorella]
MFRLTIILSVAGCITAESWFSRNSAATDSQIRFAIENKYDHTGPGAQGPEYAYKTYKHLDEAILAYMNDPDTHLPEHEKHRAIYHFTQPAYYPPSNSINHVERLPRYQPKTVDEYTGYKPQPPQTPDIDFATYNPQGIDHNVVTDYTGWKPYEVTGHRKPIDDPSYYKPRPSEITLNYPKEHTKLGFKTINSEVRPVHAKSPAHLADPAHEYDPHPQYSFSYGVHDKGTGDSKSAHETRDGGTVRGYYTFMDADGKQRTVHYTADDKRGFRANVQRTHTNKQ